MTFKEHCFQVYSILPKILWPHGKSIKSLTDEELANEFQTLGKMASSIEGSFIEQNVKPEELEMECRLRMSRNGIVYVHDNAPGTVHLKVRWKPSNKPKTLKQPVVNDVSIVDTEEMKEDETIDVTPLEEFFFPRGISINKILPKMDHDEAYDKMALFIGDHYTQVCGFMKAIKRNICNNSRFNLNMQNFTQSSIGYTCQLGKMLFDNALLTEYHYYKSPQRLITARPSALGAGQSLLTGGWLERYARLKIQQVLEDLKDEYSFESYIYNNIQIMLPNDDLFELDLIVMVDDRTYWIECKSSSYQEHILKYSQFGAKYFFDMNRMYLLAADTDEKTAESLSSQYKMNVTNIATFENTLREALRKDLEESSKE